MVSRMTKIYCADSSCKFLNDNGVCTEKTVTLGWSSVMTLNDGRKEFNKCKTHEKSDRAKELEKYFEKLFNDGERISDDITFCMDSNACQNRKCERHECNIKCMGIPHSFAQLKGVAILCPGFIQKDGEHDDHNHNG